MSAATLLTQLRARGVRLRVDGDRLRVVCPQGALTDAETADAREHRDDLIAQLRRERIEASPAAEQDVQIDAELDHDRAAAVGRARAGAAFKQAKAEHERAVKRDAWKKAKGYRRYVVARFTTPGPEALEAAARIELDLEAGDGPWRATREGRAFLARSLLAQLSYGQKTGSAALAVWTGGEVIHA